MISKLIISKTAKGERFVKPKLAAISCALFLFVLFVGCGDDPPTDVVDVGEDGVEDLTEDVTDVTVDEGDFNDVTEHPPVDIIDLPSILGELSAFIMVLIDDDEFRNLLRGGMRKTTEVGSYARPQGTPAQRSIFNATGGIASR